MNDICEDFDKTDSFQGNSKTPEELAAEMERRERLQEALFSNITPPMGYVQRDETWMNTSNVTSLSAANLEKAREYLTKISHLHVPYNHKSGNLVLCAGCLAVRALEEIK